MIKFTHRQLVKVARKWLARRAPVVVTEMASYGMEEPDAIAFHANGHTQLVECKATRADFLSDGNKIFRANPELGMGAERYYLTAPAVCEAEDVPANWGLLVWDGRRVRVVRESEHFAERAHSSEIGLLVSVVRRFGLPVRGGISVRCYTTRSEGRPRATLGLMEDEAETPGTNLAPHALSARSEGFFERKAEDTHTLLDLPQLSDAEAD